MDHNFAKKIAMDFVERYNRDTDETGRTGPEQAIAWYDHNFSDKITPEDHKMIHEELKKFKVD